MTQSKREPFSVILLEYSDAGGQTYSVEVFGTKIAGNFGLDGSNRKCAELNAAFNARVDEEVKVALAHQEMELFSEKKIYESIEKAVSRAVAERDARIAALEKELSEWKESARVEAEEGDRARARIAELEQVLVGASEYIEGLAKRTGVLHGNIPEIRKALGKGER